MWKPSIHMPRWASRLTLEIVDVRVERVQEISEADALAEGVEATRERSGNAIYWSSAVANYAQLWDGINAKRGHGWGTNCWIWAITFRRVE